MSGHPTPPSFDSNSRLVLVASTGGHLEQLHRWLDRWHVPSHQVHWVTFSNEQSKSLLDGWSSTYVNYVRPRDLLGTFRTVDPIRDAIRTLKATHVVSTGAAVAVSGAIAARRERVPFTYIESLARVDRLSTTAGILARVPNIKRYVQSDRLASSKFTYAGSILDDFYTENVQPRSSSDRLRIFVTVGTIKPYGFDRLLEAVDRVTSDDDVTWQIGESGYAPSHGTVKRSMPRSELVEHLEHCDVVVAHAGVGSILGALAAGRVPVIAARSRRFGEHIDDHQQDIARLLAARGLVRHIDPGTLDRNELLSATAIQSKVRNLG